MAIKSSKTRTVKFNLDQETLDKVINGVISSNQNNLDTNWENEANLDEQISSLQTCSKNEDSTCSDDELWLRIQNKITSDAAQKPACSEEELWDRIERKIQESNTPHVTSIVDLRREKNTKNASPSFSMKIWGIALAVTLSAVVIIPKLFDSSIERQNAPTFKGSSQSANLSCEVMLTGQTKSISLAPSQEVKTFPINTPFVFQSKCTSTAYIHTLVENGTDKILNPNFLISPSDSFVTINDHNNSPFGFVTPTDQKTLTVTWSATIKEIDQTIVLETLNSHSENEKENRSENPSIQRITLKREDSID